MKKMITLFILAIILLGCSKSDIDTVPQDNLRTDNYITTNDIKFSYGSFQIVTEGYDLVDGQIMINANFTFENRTNQDVELNKNSFIAYTRDNIEITPEDFTTIEVKSKDSSMGIVSFKLNYKDLENLNFRISLPYIDSEVIKLSNWVIG